MEEVMKEIRGEEEKKCVMWLVRFVAHLRDDLHRFFCIHCHSNGRHTPREILLHNLGVDIINFYDGSRDQPAAVYFTSPIVNFNHWLHFIDHKTPSAHSPIGKWGWMHINARYISDMAYDIPQLHLSSYGRRGFPFRYWHPKNGKSPHWEKYWNENRPKFSFMAMIFAQRCSINTIAVKLRSFLMIYITNYSEITNLINGYKNAFEYWTKFSSNHSGIRRAHLMTCWVRYSFARIQGQ